MPTYSLLIKLQLQIVEMIYKKPRPAGCLKE
jgi:hypothetical protein